MPEEVIIHHTINPAEVFIEKKSKLKKWFKNPYNFIALLIFIAIVYFRLRYFLLAQNQPLWWDEAEYIASAKSYAGIIDYQTGAGRLPGFPLLASLFFIIGVQSEPMLRFFLAYLPSIAVILLVFIAASIMYSDKKIAIISMTMLAVLWEHVFYSNRFHTENPALIFQLLAFIVLFKFYLSKDSIKMRFYSLLAVFALSFLAVFFRPGNAVFIPAIFLFLIFFHRKFLFEKKHRKYSIGFLVFVIFILIFLIQVPRQGVFSPLSNFDSYLTNLNQPAQFNHLSVFSGFLRPVFFITFIIGILAILFDIYIYYSKLKNSETDSKGNELNADIFNILVVICTLAFFMFILKTPGYEYRWYFPFALSVFIISAKGIISISNLIGSFLNQKNLILVLIILITVLGLFSQIKYADSIIKNKLTSYSQVKDSGIWMKEHSNKDDVILSASHTQHAYYAERKMVNYGISGPNQSEELFNLELNRIKPKFMVVSGFENIPEWVFSWPQRHNQSVLPVQAYFQDINGQRQPILVVYELKYT